MLFPGKVFFITFQSSFPSLATRFLCPLLFSPVFKQIVYHFYSIALQCVFRSSPAYWFPKMSNSVTLEVILGVDSKRKRVRRKTRWTHQAHTLSTLLVPGTALEPHSACHGDSLRARKGVQWAQCRQSGREPGKPMPTTKTFLSSCVQWQPVFLKH